jgi:hypothetical protein
VHISLLHKSIIRGKDVRMLHAISSNSIPQERCGYPCFLLPLISGLSLCAYEQKPAHEEHAPAGPIYAISPLIPTINPNYIRPKRLMFGLQKVMEEYAGGVTAQFSTTRARREALTLLREVSENLAAI